MKNILFYLVLLLLTISCTETNSVQLNYDDTSLQQQYAAKKLSESLQENGYNITDNNAAITLEFKIDSTLGQEAFSIKNQGSSITLEGGDQTGLIYAANTIVENLKNGVQLKNMENQSERPKLLFRAIKYDLPWDTY